MMTTTNTMSPSMQRGAAATGGLANTALARREADGEKTNWGAWVLGTGVAVGAGVLAYFLARGADAQEQPRPREDNKGGGQGGKAKGKGGGPAKGGKRNGGNAGPNVGPRGKNKGKDKDKNKGGGEDGDKAVDPNNPDGLEGYFWGDRDKVPASFDWGSNDVWFAPDCSTVAIGYWFLGEGEDAQGNARAEGLDAMLAAIGDDSDPRVRPPRPNKNGIGREANLLGILGEDRQRTAYTWLGEYYGSLLVGSNNAPPSVAAQDLIAQASERTGGTNCATRKDLWPEEMFWFENFLAQRIDEFARAAYGPDVFGGSA